MANLEAEDFREIGRMVVACAGLEFSCRPVLGAMMKFHVDMAELAFRDRNHAWILDTLSATVVQRVEDGGLRTEWAEFIGRARAVSQRRNEIVHSLWIQEGEYISDLLTSVRRKRVKGRGSLPEIHFVPQHELTRIGDEAEFLNSRLHELVRKTPGLLKPGGASTTQLPVASPD